VVENWDVRRKEGGLASGCVGGRGRGERLFSVEWLGSEGLEWLTSRLYTTVGERRKRFEASNEDGG